MIFGTSIANAASEEVSEIRSTAGCTASSGVGSLAPGFGSGNVASASRVATADALISRPARASVSNDKSSCGSIG